MKNISLPLLLALALAFVSCGKQQTDAERQAEVDRQVQERLAAEHTAQSQRDLDQRQADLDAREKAVAEKENQPAATPAKLSPNESTSGAAPVPNNAAETGSYSTFYQRLDPYGNWMETSNYGYVFQPRVAANRSDWRPYTDGHWVYTDAGWTWISDEPFGWATCHYGRWARLRGVGWVWVPGNEWAPAWVSWRRGNDFVGWAPLPPAAHFDRQTGIRNLSDNRYGIGAEQYAFVPVNEFGGPQSSRAIVPSSRNVTIINQTTNVTNITYNNSTVVDRGPSYDDLRARSQHQIPRLRLERSQDVNAEKPVIRGEVVAMPVRDFRPAQKNARPPRVERKIPLAVEEQSSQPNETPTVAPNPRLPPKATAAPTATPAPTAKAKSTAIAIATPNISATPAPATSSPTPIRRSTPFHRPTVTPAPPATPAPATPAATPAPSLNPRQQKRQERLQEMREKQKARRGEKGGGSPSSSVSPEATASPAATNTPLPGKGPRRPNEP